MPHPPPPRLRGTAGPVRSRRPVAVLVTVTDADLEAMTPSERSELTARLAAASEMPSEHGRRRRVARLLTACCLAMVPWILVLAGRLPQQYTAAHWTLTWVGFDVGLGACLAVAAWTAWRRPELFVSAATVTAALLGADAWFDVTTSAGGFDTAVSVGSAVLVELPLAALLLHAGGRRVAGDVARNGAAASPGWHALPGPAAERPRTTPRPPRSPRPRAPRRSPVLLPRSARWVQWSPTGDLDKEDTMHDDQHPTDARHLTDAQGTGSPGRGRSRAKQAGLVAAGLLAGGVLAGTVNATAATSSPSTTPSTTSTAVTAPVVPGQSGHGAFGLGITGTVTAVGTSSVTIKTATATTRYAVTSTSDIDKNGEAQLSGLAVGDTVRFSTSLTSATTIDKLHAGTESLDRPQGGPGQQGPGDTGAATTTTG